MNASDSKSAFLDASEVSKTFSSPSGELPILQSLTLRLDSGSSLAILGPSGSGKSTLLHLLGGLDRPTQGSIRVAGTDITQLRDTELARFRNRTVGFVFQDHYLLPHCTVLENVLIPALPEGVKPDVESRAHELLGRVGLTPRLGHRPPELSGGERQRVALARALILRPTLLLCDEPTGNLDPVTATTVVDLLLELHRSTEEVLIVVTHSREVAMRLDRRAELCGGKLKFLD